MAPINSVDSDQEAAISGRLRRRYRPPEATDRQQQQSNICL